MKIDIASANAELQQKTYEQIQSETASKWTNRALASYERSRNGKKLDEKLGWLCYGQEYASEAIEHAALSDDLKLLEDVKKNLNSYYMRAINSIKRFKETKGV
jgi:ABC-type phosphate transport system auxiliary subunit